MGRLLSVAPGGFRMSTMKNTWRESNKFHLGDRVIASGLISILGWAGKKTGVVVGQGREPGMVRVSLDKEWGASEAQTWWEGNWLLRDTPETTEALERFESAVQQTVNSLKTYLKSDGQARAVLREAMWRIEEKERQEFAGQWAAEHPKGAEPRPKPCLLCGQMMYPEARNLHVFWMKKKCCHHCEVTGGKEHSFYCSTAEGLRLRGEKQVYIPGEGFIPLDIATTRH